jgi:putative intracellular protease/amidase/quinol monooxygenase YgiN
MILTSHAQLGGTGKPTGFWFEELAAPYYELVGAGATVALASPAGGRPPADPASLADPAGPVAKFLDDAAAIHKLDHTQRLADVAADYDAYFVVGGHGVMWDLASDPDIARLLGTAADSGRVIAAVCHGPAALVGVRGGDGRSILDGHRVTGFSNEEEAAVHLTEAVPFLLEARLRDLAGGYERGAMWSSFVVRDGQLVTGQNPQSSAATARELLAAVADTRAPEVVPPEHPRRVTVTLRMSARDPAALTAHLRKILPATRGAPGARVVESHQGTVQPTEFLLFEVWDSIEYQQSYLAWRSRRGDVDRLVGQLTKPLAVDVFERIDA